jgi:predicted phosphodiesterase
MWSPPGRRNSLNFAAWPGPASAVRNGQGLPGGDGIERSPGHATLPRVRLAIIADIHGNQDALEAVLADVGRWQPERLIVNGDVVNRGPDSVACLERVLGRPTGLPAPEFTLGNHDDLMLLWGGPTLPPDWQTDPFWGATDWSVRQLERAGLLGALRSWPMSLRLDLSGAPSVLVAHGSPEHYREALGAFTPEERAAQLLDTGRVGVLVGSHIHRALIRQVGDRLLLNTGAVGAPFDGDPRARWLALTLAGGRWQAEIRAVPYDRAPLLARFQSSGLLGQGGLSARIFRDEIVSARSIYTPFYEQCEQAGRTKDEAAYREFQAAHPDLFLPA